MKMIKMTPVISITCFCGPEIYVLLDNKKLMISYFKGGLFFCGVSISDYLLFLRYCIVAIILKKVKFILSGY